MSVTGIFQGSWQGMSQCINFVTNVISNVTAWVRIKELGRAAVDEQISAGCFKVRTIQIGVTAQNSKLFLLSCNSCHGTKED